MLTATSSSPKSKCRCCWYVLVGCIQVQLLIVKSCWLPYDLKIPFHIDNHNFISQLLCVLLNSIIYIYHHDIPIVPHLCFSIRIHIHIHIYIYIHRMNMFGLISHVWSIKIHCWWLNPIIVRHLFTPQAIENSNKIPPVLVAICYNPPSIPFSPIMSHMYIMSTPDFAKSWFIN